MIKRSILAAILAIGFAMPAHAIESKADLNNRLGEVDLVLKEFFAMPEDKIPPDLLRKAKAIAIFPNTAKAGFVVAGQYGRGIVMTRDASGNLSAPAFFRISGGSVGFQIGGQASDIILVVTNDRGVNGLLQNKFTVGADASAAAGPVGRDADASTDWQMKASILSYSRSKGLFAGVSVEGMVINQEKDDNSTYYGEGTTAQDILVDRKVKASSEGAKIASTIEDYLKKS